MASVYRKGESDIIWVRYKDAEGKWKGKATGYRWSNAGDVRQAGLVVRRLSEEEAAARAAGSQSDRVLDDWVLPWIIGTYAGGSANTLTNYKRLWRTLSKWRKLRNINVAAQIRREHAMEYLQWRMKSAGKNQAISELKFLSMVLKEAKGRGHIAENPLTKLGLKKTPQAEKLLWQDHHLVKAAKYLEKHGKHWMVCAFYFGVYQAARLRQCQVPISAIDFEAGVIHYPAACVKGRTGFSQPIDPRFIPKLQQLVDYAHGHQKDGMLCTLPWDASLQFRHAFDAARLPGLCHHGLRATWITRAASAGVSESLAMAFCHHESREVHRIYKQLTSVAVAHVPALLSLPSPASARGYSPAR